MFIIDSSILKAYVFFRMEVGMSISNRVKAAAALRGMTIGELCSRVGVSRQFMAEMMRGSRPIPAVRLARIADVLKVSTDWLTNGDLGVR